MEKWLVWCVAFSMVAFRAISQSRKWLFNIYNKRIEQYLLKNLNEIQRCRRMNRTNWKDHWTCSLFIQLIMLNYKRCISQFNLDQMLDQTILFIYLRVISKQHIASCSLFFWLRCKINYMKRNCSSKTHVRSIIRPSIRMQIQDFIDWP